MANSLVKLEDGPYVGQEIEVTGELALGATVRVPMVDPYVEYALYRVNVDGELRFVHCKELQPEERKW